MTRIEAGLFEIAKGLEAAGRGADALILYDHLAELRPDLVEVLRVQAQGLAALGRHIEALDLISRARGTAADPAALPLQAHEQGAAANAPINGLQPAGQLAEAEAVAAALVRLMPTAPGLIEAAITCNQVLGRPEEAQRYARSLLALQPQNETALSALPPAEPAAANEDAEVEARIARVLAPDNADHALIQLRDIHDIASFILCHPLTPASTDQLRRLLSAGLALQVETEPGSEWEAWTTHYRVLLESLDPDAILAATPKAAAEPKSAFRLATGKTLDWKGLKAHADAVGAEAVFFVAADAAYIELYARWYALSVLKYADVPALIVVHVIGGAKDLDATAAAVGVHSERLVFTGDDFDQAAVTTRAFDAPPKGEAKKPIAHLQCVRFQRVGALLKQLGRPVFVSDIDLILQRGVVDLLDKHRGADVVFNENDVSFNAGSRLTANLMLLWPTEGAGVLLRFLSAYLTDKLAGERVTRWIDQVGLIHAWQHFIAHVADPKIGYFDTASDVNNVMYTKYEAHPFRFLSLFHGFDTSTLEDPRVLGQAGSASAA
jgi:tetratricopeptide (TPR) repeat protein